MQIFLKFVNFYQKFIKKFNCIIAKLNDFLKNNKKTNSCSNLCIQRKSKRRLKNLNNYSFKFRYCDILIQKKILIKTKIFDYVVFEILFQ